MHIAKTKKIAYRAFKANEIRIKRERTSPERVEFEKK